MADITTWTPISAPTDFQDDAVFNIDFKTKTVQVLVEQPIVAGENLSQFIKFQAPRFYDNIDLTEMMVNILYVSPAGNKGISAAINTEYSDDMIRCGWLVPYAACPVKGTLLFVLEFVGADYVLKTTIGSTPVLDSINDADVIPEPVEQAWYITLQANVSAALQEAQTALGRIESIFNALSAPMYAGTAVDMVDESAIYVYTGSETGYTYGNWYYYDGTEWVSGGTYASTALVTDSTLSKSGQAADAKETGRRFERVYSYESGGSSAGSGNVWVEYSVKAGHTYTFTNASSVAISPNTVRAINTYDYIEQLGTIQAGKTLTFTAVADAPALMVYSGGASTWTIAEQTTIFNLYEKTGLIDDIGSSISTLQIDSEKIGQIVSAVDLSEQYINANAWGEGYYRYASGDTSIVKVSADAPWYCQKIENLNAGKYYFNAFCSPGFTFFVDKVTGTISKASDLGVTQGVSGSLTFENAFDAYITIYDSATMSKDIAMFASGKLPSGYVYGLYKINGLYTNAQGQTIYIVGEGYIPTIQEACDLASDNDIIFIRCGTYEEQVSIWTRKLHLIGEDKLNTVLIDHSGYYDTPPLEMAKGSLSNLTIIEDGTEPFSDSSDSKYMMAYCLHIEHPNATGETFEIDNCNFINEIHVPLGCGLRGNNTVRFRNCRFYCGATDETVSQERGAFFIHSENAKNVENQWVIAENCIMESKGPRLAAVFGVPSGAQNTGSMYIRLSNCTLWNDNRGVADSTVTFDTGGGADVMKLSHSYGNSISALNGND